MKYVLEKNNKNYELMGGKATALSKMEMVIDNIPEWLVVTYTAFDVKNKCIIDEAKKEIENSLKL